MIYVIGIGPSELATGLFLIEKGYDVTIIEKMIILRALHVEKDVI